MRVLGVLRVVAIAGLGLALGVATAGASDHSGTVVSVDATAGTLVIGELGPWQVREGKTLITERTITVAPSTRFVAVTRSREAGPSGWVGELVEVPLDPWAVRQGDFVTVRAGRADRGLLAEKVTVTAGYE
ncbi:MAG TPA: hypothetical protein DCQ64_28620 [Candidatus Rokubacteria bacterium]|nr:hypothetical protein [Candidatus Rokubacteria bacterium]